MKKYLLLFMALLLYNIAYSAPSNTLSISPVAVDATTITAADENTRNNAVVTTYNAHTHTDISQTENILNVGDALAGDKAITAYNADTNKPYLKYDDTNNYWIFSTDGVTPSAVIQGTGLIFEGATDDTFETTLSITDPTADRTITLPNADINFVTGLPIVNGGTGAITAQLAINALAGGVTANRVLRGDGSNIGLAQVVLTTDVTGTLPIGNGGTGATATANTANGVTILGADSYLPDTSVDVTALAFKLKWVKFQGSDGTILSSSGVTSVVRNSAGKYTITWSVAFANANYSVIAMPEDDASERNTLASIQQNGQAAGTIVINTQRSSTAGAFDFPSVCVIAIGN